jgi:hypothetical protein
MITTRTVTFALAALALTSTARGQQPSDVPDMPRPAEIVERVNELLDDSPEETLEVPGVARLVYKRIPLDVHAVALRFGQTLSGKQEPRGMDLDRYVRQFEGQIQGVIDARLQQDVGELELLVPVKAKSKAIAPGKYRVGIGLKGGRPAALVLSGEPLPRGKALPLKLKVRRPELEPDAEGALRLALAEPETQAQGAERFDLVAALRGAEAVTAAPFARVAEAAEADEGADGEDDEE